MKQIEDAIRSLREELSELERSLIDWDNTARSKSGAARYKAIAKTIASSAHHLESLIRQNTFPAA
jgi:hypothetical protein